MGSTDRLVRAVTLMSRQESIRVKSPTFRRLLAVSFALAVIAIPLASAGASGVPRGASVARVQLSAENASQPLTKAQVQKLTAHANQRVIVIMRDQFKTLTGRSHGMLSTRSAAVNALQRPVLSELHQVHAANIKAFTIINAVSATVSKAEAAHLRTNPAVRAVIRDMPIKMPTVPREPVQAVAKPHAALPPCSTTQAPTLAPEALSLTNTAQGTTQTDAQSLSTGKGVTVAFLADGVDPFNPDFIRPDGSLVFTDYEDFTGTGLGGVTGGAEAFGDASSIAAQGNQTYNLNNYLAGVYKNPAVCHNIRVLGVAPGASLMALQVFGNATSSFNSVFIAAIQYAVANGANVINESFGGYPFPDTGIDPVAMANDQAVADGVTVVASSGDNGTVAGPGSPASDPNIIGVGATTQFQSYVQESNAGAYLGNGKYISNNISSISSGGVAQNGQKSVDVVAPGDLGWALCSTDAYTYTDCLSNDGLPTPIQDFGGTSESSPLVSGEAALVIQAYADTHKGAIPAPSIVKQIITGTATDLGAPSSEQGAGLINSLKAVRSARAWGNSSKNGDSLVETPTTLSASGAPGTSVNLPFKITDNGAHGQFVTPHLVKYAPPFAQSNTTVTLDPSKDPTLTNVAGAPRAYQTQTFSVPSGAKRLDASIAWNVTKEPGTICYLSLFTPDGTFAAYSIPQGFGSGYGHVSVQAPAAGTWKAYVFTRVVGSTAYSGPVQFTAASSKLVMAGTVSPTSRKLAQGQTGKFILHTQIPAASGDAGYSLRVHGNWSNGGVIPVFLRSEIPATVSTPGTFSGTLTGGNGRGGPGQTLTYEFNVPNGVHDLALNTSMSDSGYNLLGFLVNPEGYALDTQTTIASVDKNGAITAYNKTLQFFWRNPEPGSWKFVLDLNYFASGLQTSLPFMGTLAYNTVNVTAPTLPNSASTNLPSGQAVAVPVQITNTGNTTENYFVDARLAQTTELYLGSTEITVPGNKQFVTVIPPETTSASITSQSLTSVPINFDFSPNYGDPDVAGTPGFNIFGHPAADATVSSSELTPGLWEASPTIIGPTPNGGPASTVADLGGLATTQAFDGAVTSTSGDFWANAAGASTAPYKPLALAPGASGTITVTVKPNAAAGTVVAGNIYVDTLAASPDFSTTTGFWFTGAGGDEVTALPYTYTVSAS